MKAASLTRRMILLAAVLITVLLLYSLRLMDFQVVNGENFEKQIERGWETTQVIKAARGEILDRNGRPLAMNTVGRNVVINEAYMEKGSDGYMTVVEKQTRTNEILHKLIGIMEAADESWTDNLPLTADAPFAFQEGSTGEIATLKKTLGVEQYATPDDVVSLLKERYAMEEGYRDADFRKIVGVRYEMTRSGFDKANPYTFATDIKIETVPKIKERSFELPGVDVVESTIRQYVSGDIGPHIVGQEGKIYKEQWDQAIEEGGVKTVDGINYATINGQIYKMNDTIGKDGAELAFEKYLRGQDGERRIVLDNQNSVVDIIEEKPPIPGNTVVTTLDSQLQKVAQDALVEKILSMQKDLVNYPPGKGHEANAGAVAVVNVKTGEVLALVTYPSYNLSTFRADYSALAADPLHPLFNRALDGNYMPGSIFKPVVALGALNEGVVTPHDTVNCTFVYTFYDDYQPRCLSTHGMINVVGALRASCNIFFYDVGRRLGIEKIEEYATRLGMGQPTGIELPEYQGRVSSPALKAALPGHRDDPNWHPGDVLQSSIGQMDTRLSPLQLANYTATLANNGKRMKLSLLKSVKSYTFDETIYEHQPQVAEKIDADAAFNAVREGMVAASALGGTSGSYFGNYSMKVASKTGTPETAAEPNSTFIAYAPADDPEIAVCVVIEKGWHGYTGAPVAKAIFDAYFHTNAGKAADISGYGTLLS